MKYGIWSIGSYAQEAWEAVCGAGYSPLLSAVLCSRGYTTTQQICDYLSCEAEPADPLLMRDMEAAAARVRRAIAAGERIAVFGDYDVDGITSTCLLTDYLRSKGAVVQSYIPSRLEEGYGLNEIAIRSLCAQSVQLIVTVDCGITAEDEAQLCKACGIDLIITDHHECKPTLPEAIAVVDPHRPDDTYPHRMLAGVGVAFKLAAAIEGDQQCVLERYCDLVCLGTVADVMPLVGENRMFVAQGLKRLCSQPRLGITALMKECGCADSEITATLIGYTLAPRINAAGRMGEVMTAVDLFLTDDPAVAQERAAQLCQMNRERQSVESGIYREAREMLEKRGVPNAIVLAGENWHQGVVGIVASRLAEDYGCPTFLVCMDGEKGKASSRSCGGFHLFRALETLSPLLESFGGHDLAAGFTISRENIDEFAKQMDALVAQYRATGNYQEALTVDCAVAPEYLTVDAVSSLSQLEPCGVGCPKPVLCVQKMYIAQLSSVGNGRHLRLRLVRGSTEMNAIFFSATAQSARVAEGDTVDVAFYPQINTYRGITSVQLNVIDIRPSASAAPNRERFAAVWKYLIANGRNGEWNGTLAILARGAARLGGFAEDAAQTQVCLDVLEELQLLRVQHFPEFLTITTDRSGKKVSLSSSRILRNLKDGD